MRRVFLITFERSKIYRMRKARGTRPNTPLVDLVVEGIQEVKGKDIIHLDLRNVPNTVCDHFVICHGDSDTQVEAIAGSVEKMVRDRTGERPWHAEGREVRGWIILDYVDVVVHIFHREKRAFYALEDLWADAESRRFENVA